MIPCVRAACECGAERRGRRWSFTRGRVWDSGVVSLVDGSRSSLCPPRTSCPQAQPQASAHRHRGRTAHPDIGYRRICRGPSKAHAMWVCDCGGRAMFLSSVISRHSGARTPDVPDHRAAARTGLYRVQSDGLSWSLVAGYVRNVRWTARTARRARAAPGVDIAHRSSVRRSQLSSPPRASSG